MWCAGEGKGAFSCLLCFLPEIRHYVMVLCKPSSKPPTVFKMADYRETLATCACMTKTVKRELQIKNWNVENETWMNVEINLVYWKLNLNIENKTWILAGIERHSSGCHWVSTCYRFERKSQVVKRSRMCVLLGTYPTYLVKKKVNPKEKRRKKRNTKTKKIMWPGVEPYTLWHEIHFARYAKRTKRRSLV